jgi:hypothetical protein
LLLLQRTVVAPGHQAANALTARCAELAKADQCDRHGSINAAKVRAAKLRDRWQGKLR